MDERGFESLIKRMLSGEASREEQALVEKWLEGRENKHRFSNLPDGEKEEIRTRIFARLTSKIREQGRGGTRTSTMNGTRIFRAAAAVIFICVLVYPILKFSSPADSDTTAVLQSKDSSGASKKIILSDSSIVWLKGQSSIEYPENFNGGVRNVKLTGEALFEVSKDPLHPFIIQCGGLTAKVLGTSFNIKSNETDVEVLVLTGKVAVSSTANNSSLIVLPNEKVIYSESKKHMEKVSITIDEKVLKTQGTQYSMKFEATSMREIIRRIEGKFDVRVIMSNDRLGNCTITGDFTDQSLERTLRMIAQTLEIEYEINNKGVVLKGDGCD